MGEFSLDGTALALLLLVDPMLGTPRSGRNRSGVEVFLNRKEDLTEELRVLCSEIWLTLGEWERVPKGETLATEGKEWRLLSESDERRVEEVEGNLMMGIGSAVTGLA